MPYIALLCPAAISLAIFRKRRGSDLKVIDSVVAYLCFVLMINWLTMCTSVYLLKIYDSQMVFMENFVFFTKYVAIALAFALILPPLFDLFQKFFVIRFNDKKK